MSRIFLCVMVAAGLAVAAPHRSVVKVPCPDTTKVMKSDTTKVAKGDSVVITIVNKPEIEVSIDTFVITTDTVKVTAKKAAVVKSITPVKPAAPAKAEAAPAPATPKK